jgi:drug/metabolite transporter (DMT)-like permease
LFGNLLCLHTWREHGKSPEPAPSMTFALWIPATLAAAAAQTARNAMQRHLTEVLGTVGATQVRFLYGFPFALLFLAGVLAITGESLPPANAGFLGFVAVGAVTQVAATALMLAAMRERSFSLVTAYVKTEPVQVAVFGLAVLGDPLTILTTLAIGIATFGVLMTSVRPGGGMVEGGSARPVLLGLAAGTFFALAAISFRGATLTLEPASFFVRATTALAWGLATQTTLLLLWLGIFNRAALISSFRHWRSSLLAGFLGALASQFWFIGFALTSAANVRTLGLVEVPLAYGVSFFIFGQRPSGRDIAGMGLIVAGVVLLLLAQ